MTELWQRTYRSYIRHHFRLRHLSTYDRNQCRDWIRRYRINLKYARK